MTRLRHPIRVIRPVKQSRFPSLFIKQVRIQGQAASVTDWWKNPPFRVRVGHPRLSQPTGLPSGSAPFFSFIGLPLMHEVSALPYRPPSLTEVLPVQSAVIRHASRRLHRVFTSQDFSGFFYWSSISPLTLSASLTFSILPYKGSPHLPSARRSFASLRPLFPSRSTSSLLPAPTTHGNPFGPTLDPCQLFIPLVALPYSAVKRPSNLNSPDSAPRRKSKVPEE